MASIHDTTKQRLLGAGWLKHVEWYERTDSTSTRARHWLEQSSDQPQQLPGTLPALFVADEQTTGRGRNDHRWFSPAGCLMQTFVLAGETLPPDRGLWSQLALIAGLAVAEAIEDEVPALHAELKWPNDVFLSGKKCAGILIESGPYAAASLPSWLIGIGLNVDIDWTKAPEDVVSRATCMSTASGTYVDLPDVLCKVVEQVHRNITAWSKGDSEWWYRWRKRCLLTGKQVSLQETQGELLVGKCQGISGKGQLLLNTSEGLREILSGEIIAWQ